jgi:hypothetical protein
MSHPGKMNPERARLLRDEVRHQRRPALVPQPGTCKHREIRFATLRPGQVEQAWQMLGELEHLRIGTGLLQNSISVWYEISDYTLESLETALVERGFHLENSLYCKLVRAIVYFCEETQRRNLSQPERLIKKSNEVYVKAWEHHPHGDHDDTPPELRKFK